MNGYSLSVSLSTALIIVLAVAAVLIAGGVVGVLIGGRISAGKGGKRGKRTAEKSVKPAKARPVNEVKRTEEKPVQAPSVGKAEEVKPAPAADAAREIKPAEKVEKPAPEKAQTVAEPVESAPKVTEAETPAEAHAAEVSPAPAPVKPAPAQPEQAKPAPAEKPVKESKPEGKVEVVKSDDGNAFVRIRYNRSFTAKLIQADDKVKNYYSKIKNELKKYPVKERTSWRYETFKTGRKLLAKVTLRGKTLCLYCALNAADYAGAKYKVEDVSSKKSNADVPALFRIRNDRRAKYSEKIIADLMEKNSLQAGEERYEDYAAQYPYEELEPLIERKLVKLLALKTAAAESEVATLPVTETLPREVLEEVAAEEPAPVAELPPEEVLQEVSVTQADEILPDEEVEIFIKESERVSDKTKRAIVNIDTLGKHFKSGEKVTLEEIKRRVPDVSKRTTYIKILARGTLDKPLEVEADDFSPAAVKMIILTGGKVNRTRTAQK